MELFTGPLEDFPASDECPAGVPAVSLADEFPFPVDLLPGVIYAKRETRSLVMHILSATDMLSPDRRFPLVVFVQGSAWREQHLFGHLQHLVRVAEKGYIAAIVQYRPSDEAPFPAQVEDAKEAIRFLRSNAEKYHVDPGRVALWGDSSGAHTAVMAGITGDGEPGASAAGGVSASVRCIVDWFGPTDISRMNDRPSMLEHRLPDSPEGMLIGGRSVPDHPEAASGTSPMRYLREDRPTPPILIMHGTKDQLVPFHQSVLLYDELVRLGKPVEMVCLDGAYHGFGGFNSTSALEFVLDFLGRYL